MATAGQRTCFCEFLAAPPRNALGESTPDVTKWVVYASAWGSKRGLRGGELALAREQQDQETEEFFFPYVDLIDPNGDGTSVTTAMVIRFDDGTAKGVLYDIDGMFPDETSRREVRIMAIRKRLPVS